MAGTAPTSTDCVAYLKFEGNVTDNVGTYTWTAGASSGSTGIIDNCYSYDGTNDGIYADDPIFNYETQTWTACGWFKRDSTAYMRCFGNYDGSKGIECNWKDDGYFHIGGKDTGGYESWASSTANIAVSSTTWHFIVFGIDAGYPFVSVDGGTIEKSGTTLLDSGTYTAGNWYIGTNATGSTPFSGLIDEVSLFDIALTQDNITYLRNGGSPGTAQQYPFSSAPAPVYFATIEDVAKKIGTGASVTSSSETLFNNFLFQITGFVNAACRFNFSDVYSELNTETKGIINEITANLIAIYTIAYDMSGYESIIEAEDMINVLRDVAIKNLQLLKDKKVTDFIREV